MRLPHMKWIKSHWWRSLMKTLFVRFLKDESGVTAIEYGLIAGLISIVILVAVTAIGTSLQGLFQTIATDLAGA
jgi:pilus assembly protein Flp/PilA